MLREVTWKARKSTVYEYSPVLAGPRAIFTLSNALPLSSLGRAEVLPGILTGPRTICGQMEDAFWAVCFINDACRERVSLIIQTSFTWRMLPRWLRCLFSITEESFYANEEGNAVRTGHAAPMDERKSIGLARVFFRTAGILGINFHKYFTSLFNLSWLIDLFVM